MAEGTEGISLPLNKHTAITFCGERPIDRNNPE
jgi:hypothetical protein